MGACDARSRDTVEESFAQYPWSPGMFVDDPLLEADFTCRSATIASVVIIREPTEAACYNADRTTLVGSMMPALIMSLNSPVCASKPQL
jgi:hypothetical protein